MHELSLAANIDQAGAGELFNVVGQGGSGDGKMTAKRAAGCFVAACDEAQNLIAPRVCQGFGDAMKVVRLHD